MSAQSTWSFKICHITTAGSANNRVVCVDPFVVVSLWVTKGHLSKYQQVTLKVAPVGDHKDSQGITLAPTKKLTRVKIRRYPLNSYSLFNFKPPKQGVNQGTLKKTVFREGHVHYETWVCSDRGAKPLRVDLWLSLVLSTSLLRPMSLIFTMGSDSSDNHISTFSGFRCPAWANLGPSINFSHANSALAAVDQQLKLKMRPDAQPGFRIKSSRLKQTWTPSYVLTQRPRRPHQWPPAMSWWIDLKQRH